MYEIERKFLIKNLPDLPLLKIVRIEQFYLSTDSKIVLRIRQFGEKYLLTLKSGDLNVRLEKEIEISAKDFEDLKLFGIENKIVKDRHIYLFDKYKIETDVFLENLKGLIVAEIEFGNKAESDGFVPPEWLGIEVTSDYRYTNSYLSKTQKIPE